MNTCKVIAFDCDGVMFDTINANMAYYNHILGNFNRPEMTSEQLAYVHMHTADYALNHLFDDKKGLAAAQEYRKSLSYVPFLKYMKIEPALRPLLKKLRLKYKTAIVTNRTDTIDNVLIQNNIKKDFDIVVSALDVILPKPHPEGLIKILRHFDIKPDQAIYIGDSKLDEMAASSAEIPFVAYSNKTLSAKHHITSLSEIEQIL